jgi:hypothetical protein
VNIFSYICKTSCVFFFFFFFFIRNTFDTSHLFTLVRYSNRSKYTIDLKQIIIAGKSFPFEEGHETILDSGATYTYLLVATFVAFKDAVR